MADLFNSISAYSGTYKLEGASLKNQVEIATDPDWVGSAQVRTVSMDKDKLVVATPVVASPDGKRYKVTLVWSRVE